MATAPAAPDFAKCYETAEPTRNRVTDYRPRLSERFGLKHRAHQALVGRPTLQKMLLG